jgi:hypothetical protein
LLCTFESDNRLESLKGLGHTRRNKNQCSNKTDRHQDIKGPANSIDPEIAESSCLATRKTAYKRNCNRKTYGR